MKQDRLSHCLSNINSRYIEEAENYIKKKKNPWIKWGLTAACFGLFIFSMVQFNNTKLPDNVTPPGGNSAIHVPAIELPKETDGVAMDMMGLIVYKGRIYTQARWYTDEDAIDVEKLVGKKLGTAVGNIDEWSSQDDYAVEFASTITGDVYSVNGYSTDFRICTRDSFEDANGNNVLYINFYENLNGIDIATGKDLFETRLKLLENWNTVQYQTHDNWDNGAPDYVFNDLTGISDKDINTFLETLNSSDFEYVYESNPDFYSGSSKQAHLYLHMDDATVIELRLFEGGYVGYQHMGWYFVKMPSEIFDLIFNASL